MFDKIKMLWSLVKAFFSLPTIEKLLEKDREILALRDEKAALKREAETLRETLRTKLKLRFSNNAYWDGEGQDADGPFCSKCWDTEGKMVRLHHNDPGSAYSHCPVCQKNIAIPRRENAFKAAEPFSIKGNAPTRTNWNRG